MFVAVFYLLGLAGICPPGPHDSTTYRIPGGEVPLEITDSPKPPPNQRD